ncbi:response regulator [Pedobacter aquatilis]|uniref:response regulator transcription factor n=1 Tax=Pedobacter aquatilis TaxID=351343 RepID=UPI0025B4A263|nr:response regulator [Pedobacter aquatilis]MDN3587541.1 response regulator [Pedobacter aquatilis]
MKKKIYILEDTIDILELLEEILTTAGYEVTGFTNVAEFNLALKGDKPDLFLMDVMLPDGHGINICEHLKLDRNTKAIPVILLTANVEIEKMKLRSRADDFIPKPFDIADLTNRVARQLTD